MTDMREAVARAILNHRSHLQTDTEWAIQDDETRHWYLGLADAALLLMQPEIDRRVAEERAKLLERLREPSEGMENAGRAGLPLDVDSDYAPIVWRDMLAQFEKENSHEQG